VGSARRSWLSFPLWIGLLGWSESMVPGGGGVNGGVDARRPAAGSVDRRRRSGEAQGFILYLIKAGRLPVRFRRSIAGALGRWPEEEGGVL